jgi:hypothetical protein
LYNEKTNQKIIVLAENQLPYLALDCVLAVGSETGV